MQGGRAHLNLLDRDEQKVRLGEFCDLGQNTTLKN